MRRPIPKKKGRPRKYPELYVPETFAKWREEYGSDLAIARKTGYSVGAVHNAGVVLKMPYTGKRGSGQPKYPQLYDPKALSALLVKHGSYVAVARAVGCSPVTVRYAHRKIMRERESP